MTIPVFHYGQASKGVGGGVGWGWGGLGCLKGFINYYFEQLTHFVAKFRSPLVSCGGPVVAESVCKFCV